MTRSHHFSLKRKLCFEENCTIMAIGIFVVTSRHSRRKKSPGSYMGCEMKPVNLFKKGFSKG
jgi:hypothetical protein